VFLSEAQKPQDVSILTDTQNWFDDKCLLISRHIRKQSRVMLWGFDSLSLGV